MCAKNFCIFVFSCSTCFFPFFLHFLLAHGRTCHNLTPQKLVNRDFDGDCNEKLKHKKKRGSDFLLFGRLSNSGMNFCEYLSSTVAIVSRISKCLCRQELKINHDLDVYLNSRYLSAWFLPSFTELLQGVRAGRSLLVSNHNLCVCVPEDRYSIWPRDVELLGVLGISAGPQDLLVFMGFTDFSLWLLAVFSLNCGSACLVAPGVWTTKYSG